jgi:hypothetical protein
MRWIFRILSLWIEDPTPIVVDNQLSYGNYDVDLTKEPHDCILWFKILENDYFYLKLIHNLFMC